MSRYPAYGTFFSEIVQGFCSATYPPTLRVISIFRSRDKAWHDRMSLVSLSTIKVTYYGDVIYRFTFDVELVVTFR
jgi:hypothetical protein